MGKINFFYLDELRGFLDRWSAVFAAEGVAASALRSLDSDPLNVICLPFSDYSKVCECFTLGVFKEADLVKLRNESYFSRALSFDAYIVENENVLMALKNFLWKTHKRTEVFIVTQIFSSDTAFMQFSQELAELMKDRSQAFSEEPLEVNRVEYVLRTIPGRVQVLRRALQSLADQSYKNIQVQLILIGENDAAKKLSEDFMPYFPIRCIEESRECPRSSSLWKALRRVEAPYFALLDDDDRVFSNHVSQCLQVLSRHSRASLAYGGSLRTWEPANQAQLTLNQYCSELAYCEPFNLKKLLNLDNYIPSNSWVARTACLKDDLVLDPGLDLMEDVCLLLGLASTGDFVFTHSVSSEFFWRSSKTENASFLEQRQWAAAADQLVLRFWNVPFYSGVSILSEKLQKKYLRDEVSSLGAVKKWLRNKINRDF